MDKQQHIINKVFLDINTASEQEAYGFQENISGLLAERVFPELEKLFDDIGDNETIIRINKIDLTVDISYQEIQRMLHTKILKKIEREIGPLSTYFNKNVNGNGSLNFSLFENGTHSKNKGSSENQLVNESQKVQNHQISFSDNLTTLFTYFLENGYLPWYGNTEQLNELYEPSVWEEKLADKAFVTELQKVLSSSNPATERFAAQVPGKNVLLFLNKLDVINLSSVTEIEKYTQTLNIQRKRRFLKLLVEMSFRTVRNDDELKLKILFDYFEGEVNTSASFIKQFTELKTFLNRHLRKELFEKYFKLLDKQKGKIQRWLEEENPSIKSKRGHTQKVSDIENISTVISQRVNLKSEKEPLFFETDSNEIVVSNAGQVLFHPFVSGLFHHFGWLDPQKQIIDDHKEKALQTLHYCATGKDVYLESDMILEKFFCGIPLKSTLPVSSMLNDEIRQESDHMLSELIKKWPALKNTSPDGLRQMFVMRSGKLIQQKSGFKLIVERKAQDVLLEKLPWGLSIVKLPWLKELLFVEW